VNGGIVGIIANEAARYSRFASCVTNLRAPAGSKVEWLIGGDWCGARNTLARMTLDSDAEWLWFMDDDHAFSPEILNGLLHHDLPLVLPVCLTRVPPFQPVTYTEKIDENLYLPLPLDEHPEAGLVRLEAGGCAGMLIRRHVLEAIPPPWFEYTDRSEDIVFCEKAKAAGFELHCDLAARLGHITTAVVWPAISDGSWVTGVTIGGEMNIFIPTSTREEPSLAPSV
jgi:hypothetical protein